MRRIILMGLALTTLAPCANVKLKPEVFQDIVKTSYACGQIDGIVATLLVIGGYDDKIPHLLDSRAKAGCGRVDDLRGVVGK